MSKLRALCFLLAAWASLVPVRATASELDEAKSAYETGDFAGATRLLERARDSGTLGPVDVIVYLEIAASIAFVQGEAEEGANLARRIAALTATFHAGRSTPPEVTESVARARREGARFSVSAMEQSVGSGVRISFVANDPLGLARRFRTYQREGSGEWAISEGESALLSGGAAYYVEVLGEHGNVVHTLGTRSEPRFARGIVAAHAPESRSGPWVVLGAGASALVAGAVVYGLGRSLARDIEETPDGAPYTTQIEADVARAERRSRWGGAAMLVGGAAVVAGLVWRLTSRHTTDAELALSPRGVKLHLRF